MSIKEFEQDDVIINPDLPSDALSSKQFNTIIEIISEGEIAGFATPLKKGIATNNAAYKTAALTDIFLNKTPISNISTELSNSAFLSKVQNAEDSDFNFKNVGFDFREGTSNQTAISGIKSTEQEVSVGTNVTTSTAVTHTITNTNVESVRVTLRFPSLQKFEDDGDITGVEVQLRIKTIQANGTTQTNITDTVKGRSTNAYFRDYQIDFANNNITSFPVQVRVERITADSSDAKLVNSFSFHTATEIIFDQNTYPNTAHIALRLNAEQFPRIPRRTFRIRGIKVEIPSNATVQSDGSITYSGTWNGQFKSDKEWTSDPAWILYDILRNDRYGCSVPAANIDKFTFKSISEYCGEQVDDGQGGTEPRFSCNVNITQAREAFDLINDLCSVMRVMPFYSADTITLSQDSPSDPIFLFNQTNVTDAGFLYAGSSLKTRNTVINVSYFDMQIQDIDVETVEADAATQAKYGIVVKNINAFATTSRGQANRLGKWFLFNEQNSGESCTFTTTIDAGVTVRCGHIIEISDPLKAGVRRGGRIKSVNGLNLVLDDFSNTDIPSINQNPTISVMLPDNSLETRVIDAVNENNITLVSAFSQNPNPDSVYIIETPTLKTTLWRVLNISENADSTFTITALLHQEGKYDFVEDGTPLPTRNITTLTEIKPSPSNVVIEEKIVEINNRAVTKIMVDWANVGGASKYRIFYRFQNGDFTQIDTTSTNFEILNTKAGEYEFRLFAYNGLGEPSVQPTVINFTAVGQTAVPADVQNLTLEPINDEQVRLRWQQTTDLDVKFGGQVYIRHSPRTDGSGTFANSTDLIEALSGNSTEAICAAKTGEYILKFRDLGGRFSSGEASVIVTMPETREKLALPTIREETAFSGTKTNTTVTSNQLTLTDPSANQNGSYSFNNTIDLGSVFSINLKSVLLSTSANVSDLFDSIPNLDLRENFDGAAAEKVNAKLFVRTTNDNPSSSPTFTDFNTFQNGIFKARAFEFKVDLETEDTNENILIQSLGVDSFLPARTEQSTAIISSGASTKAVTFIAPFFTGTSSIGGVNFYPPSIGITAQNMQSGDFFDITNITGTGFSITFKNQSGSAVSRNFSYSAVGFGRGV
tara:strand:- start:6990 stop:10301 length:3312 start_codon:yes stop_codon:yes gene_type:complete